MYQRIQTLQRDHPRLRGEYRSSNAGINFTVGSPPPTRGILKDIAVSDMLLGITPAYAGNTCLSWKAYPCDPGSPPPTRGILTLNLILSFSAGITPAYAGNTKLLMFTVMLIRDHPRLRGEYDVSIRSPILHEGSPPPTRGIRMKINLIKDTGGITPAYAGNTQSKRLGHYT